MLLYFFPAFVQIDNLRNISHPADTGLSYLVLLNAFAAWFGRGVLFRAAAEEK